MCAARNTSGALALLLSLDAKFVNKFQKNTQYFNTHYTIVPYLSNRVKSRDIVKEIYIR